MSYGRTEWLGQKKITEVFSKEEVERVIKNEMLKLESEMKLKRKWIEKELEQTASQLISKIQKAGFVQEVKQ